MQKFQTEVEDKKAFKEAVMQIAITAGLDAQLQHFERGAREY